MTTLLEEIIASAVDDKQPVRVLLRKVLVLAHQLKNEQLKSWANQELNGYANQSELPEYRQIAAQAKGNFSGAFGRVLQGWNIAPASLDEKHQRRAHTADMNQAVSAYEDIVLADKKPNSARIVVEWPNDMVLYYQDRISDDFALIAAWQEIPRSALVEIVNTVRNKILAMALELQQELGNETELSKIKPETVRQVQETIVNHIYGGTNFFSSGNAKVNASGTSAQVTIAAGDREHLREQLGRLGVETSDLTELDAAVTADGGKTIGSAVSEWLKRTAPKLLVNGVKYGAEVGKPILTELLRQYLGLPHAGM